MVAAKYSGISPTVTIGSVGGLCRSNKTRVTAAGRSTITTHITAHRYSSIQAQLSPIH